MNYNHSWKVNGNLLFAGTGFEGEANIFIWDLNTGEMVYLIYLAFILFSPTVFISPVTSFGG